MEVCKACIIIFSKKKLIEMGVMVNHVHGLHPQIVFSNELMLKIYKNKINYNYLFIFILPTWKKEFVELKVFFFFFFLSF